MDKNSNLLMGNTVSHAQLPFAPGNILVCSLETAKDITVHKDIEETFLQYCLLIHSEAFASELLISFLITCNS